MEVCLRLKVLVFNITQPGIHLWSPGPLGSTLTILSMGRYTCVFV